MHGRRHVTRHPAAEDLTRLAGDHTPRPSLMLGSESFLGCDADGMSSFAFGVKVVDDGRELTDHLVNEPEKVSGVGEEAYRATSGYGEVTTGETLVARQGDRVVYVRNELLHHGPERATEGDTIAVAKLLLSDDATELIESVPAIDVAEPCPVPDEAAALVGEIVAARGLMVDDDVQCRYASADGVVSVHGFETEDTRDFLSSSAEQVDVEGAEQASVRDEGNGFELTATGGSQVVRVAARAHSYDEKDLVDRDEFDRLSASVAKALLG